MKRKRIDFVTVDAARFNALRDEWRSTASGCALSRAGLRMAVVLPTFVNRDYGYAFPTDEDLAAAIGTKNTSTANRGIAALAKANLIERQTMVKRDERNEAIGRTRRIYLTMPEVKVQEVKVQPNVKVQKRLGEGSPVCTNILDINTRDTKTRSGRKELGAYIPARETAPSLYSNDDAFLDAFDRFFIEQTDGKQIGSGEIERIVQQAFDQATDSYDMFMPFYWRDVLNLNTSETAEWFRRRSGPLIHRRRAA